MKRMIIVTGLLAATATAYVYVQQTKTAVVPQVTHSSGMVPVNVPETLSQNAVTGKAGYEAKCAACHGANGAGQDGVAPPLIHKIYEPSHHADEAFQRAAALGVRGHHWPFGDMPPVEGISRAEVALIVAYIRELQRFNDIH